MPDRRVKLADTSPEDALKTFSLRWRLKTKRRYGPSRCQTTNSLAAERSAPHQLKYSSRLRRRIDEKPTRRLKAGDAVRMPDGEARIIKPVDVRDGRVVLWPEISPLPLRIEVVDGHWKVYARPLIAARKLADGETQTRVPTKSVGQRGRGLGRGFVRPGLTTPWDGLPICSTITRACVGFHSSAAESK